MALLTPLCGQLWQPKKGEDATVKIFKHMKNLTNLWHGLAINLHKAHWSSLDSKQKLGSALGCPPVGVTTNHPRQFTCQRPLVCPFCFARQRVMEAFMLLERFFYPNMQPETKACTGGWYLTEFIRRGDQPVQPWVPGNIAHWTKYYAALSIVPPAKRRKEMTLANAQHGIVQFQLDLPRKGILGGTRRGLLLSRKPVTREQIDLKAETHHFLCMRLDKVVKVKQHLARACATVFAYPASMLRAPVEDVMAVLSSLEGRRLQTVYGFKDQRQI